MAGFLASVSLHLPHAVSLSVFCAVYGQFVLVSRLPVIDLSTGNVLYILTHKRILRFLFLYVSKFIQQKTTKIGVKGCSRDPGVMIVI